MPSNRLVSGLIFLMIFPVWFANASSSLDSTARNPKFQKNLSLLFETGPMIPKNTDWGEFINNGLNYTALDLRLGFKNTRKNLYNRIYKYPTYGFGLYTATFKNDYIGKPNAVYAYADLPFTKTFLKGRLSYSYFAAFGLAFNFKPYDPDSNPINQFIGSYRNGYVHVGFTMRYALSPWLDLETAFGLKHFSNGSIKKPNSGLNFIPFSIGLRSTLNRAYFDQSSLSDIPKFIPNSHVNLWVSAGAKNYEIGGDVYMKWGFSVNYLKQRGYKLRYGLGMDMFYAANGTLPGNWEKSGFMDKASFAIVASGEWVLKKNFSIPLGIGVYMHRNYFNDEPSAYYERVGIRYRFSRQMFTGITLKAHGFKADFFEWTVGYAIFKDKNSY
ncbi:acyloxyacyl hydrolase [Cognataquiflexum aquatile]|uniref:acyloxyacyl hydrolase n=1 Tax=Cognataquiflexum aquatile TaxID=2249427 RepID=UPI000DE9AE96|nr:acyloxyacyl hydrolase [Cognataquiflexum aquatile]